MLAESGKLGDIDRIVLILYTVVGLYTELKVSSCFFKNIFVAV